MLWRIGRELLAGNWATDLIAGVAIVTSIATGQYVVALIVVAMLAGGALLEQFAVRRASRALDALAARMPLVAHRLREGQSEDIELTAVAIGDRLLLLPHEIVPADGVVRNGHGRMDESFLTGEPWEVEKAPGVEVISGARNGDSRLEIEVTRRPADSRYAQIMGVMKDSELRRPRLRRLADQLGAWYSPLALVIAALAGWWTGSWERFLAVIVVATPCPLLIAIPVAIIGSIARAARAGIVIRDPAILEQLPRIKNYLFDKTGTLTLGQPSLVSMAANGIGEDEALALMASLERYSKHPLAAPLLATAAARQLPLRDASEYSEKAGEGVVAIVDGEEYRITHRRRLSAEDAATLPALEAGRLECLLLRGSVWIGAFQFSDTPRRETRLFLDHLGPLHGGLRTVLVTGDSLPAANLLARQVGIQEVLAAQSPEQKLEFVRQCAAQAPTLYAGDGINDAPALAAATVGIAFGSGAQIAGEAAGAVILEPSLGKVDELLHLALRLRRVALESAVGGLALSLLGMLAAAFGFLPPLAGALVQEAIDAASVLNALRTSLGADPTDMEPAPKPKP